MLKNELIDCSFILPYNFRTIQKDYYGDNSTLFYKYYKDEKSNESVEIVINKQRFAVSQKALEYQVEHQIALRDDIDGKKIQYSSSVTEKDNIQVANIIFLNTLNSKCSLESLILFAIEDQLVMITSNQFRDCNDTTRNSKLNNQILEHLSCKKISHK